MEDDWRSKQSSFKDLFSLLLKTKHMSDCSFAAIDESGNQRIFATHKFVLAVVSPVFEAMFYGSLPEKTDAPIEIADIDAETFAIFVDLMYGQETKLKYFSMAKKVYFAAEKYMVKSIKMKCIDYVMSGICSEEVTAVYMFAKDIDEPNLMEYCLEFLKENASLVLDQDNFHNINFEVFSTILEQDSLSVFNEYELFMLLEAFAAFRYRSKEKLSTPNCDKKALRDMIFDEMRPLVKKIRFLCFSQNEFERVAFSALLTIEESSTIANCLECNAEEPDVYPEGFSKISKNRCERPCSGEISCTQCEIVYACPYYCGNSDIKEYL